MARTKKSAIDALETASSTPRTTKAHRLDAAGFRYVAGWLPPAAAAQAEALIAQHRPTAEAIAETDRPTGRPTGRPSRRPRQKEPHP